MAVRRSEGGPRPQAFRRERGRDTNRSELEGPLRQQGRFPDRGRNTTTGMRLRADMARRCVYFALGPIADTYAPLQLAASFDHLVGTEEQIGSNLEPAGWLRVAGLRQDQAALGALSGGAFFCDPPVTLRWATTIRGTSNQVSRFADASSGRVSGRRHRHRISPQTAVAVLRGSSAVRHA